MIRRSTLPLAATFILIGTAAHAFHGSCAGGQLPPGNDRCEYRNHIAVGNVGGAGFLVCSSSNTSLGEIQWDYTVIFAGRSRYVCTHYHDCSEVQGVNSRVYNAYCT